MNIQVCIGYALKMQQIDVYTVHNNKWDFIHQEIHILSTHNLPL